MTHKVLIEVEHLKVLRDVGYAVATEGEAADQLHDALFVADTLIEGVETTEG